MKTIFILFFLFVGLYNQTFAQPTNNNSHLKQSFRYARDVNPVDFLKLDPRVIEMIGGVAKFCKEHGITFMITSAVRSPEYNKAVGGESSTHVDGRAIDFSVKSAWGWTPELIKKLELYIEKRYGEYGRVSLLKRQPVILIHKVHNGAVHAHLQVSINRLDSYTNVLNTHDDGDPICIPRSK